MNGWWKYYTYLFCKRCWLMLLYVMNILNIVVFVIIISYKIAWKWRSYVFRYKRKQQLYINWYKCIYLDINKKNSLYLSSQRAPVLNDNSHRTKQFLCTHMLIMVHILLYKGVIKIIFPWFNSDVELYNMSYQIQYIGHCMSTPVLNNVKTITLLLQRLTTL